MRSNLRVLVRGGLVAVTLVIAATVVLAAPEGAPRHSPDGRPGRGDIDRDARPGRGGDRDAMPRRDRDGDARLPRDRWFDGAHGHARVYPAPGRAYPALPPYSRTVFWAGVRYGFADGVWYAPGPRGYVVVRPPYGVVVADLPVFRTLLVIGGIAYLYANGVYYRERHEGGYEVVPAPVGSEGGSASATPPRLFVYPRAGQSAEQQAGDEYECHRWAVTQSGFDPTAVVTATAGADHGRRADYQRASAACLEGRNYTVR